MDGDVGEDALVAGEIAVHELCLGGHVEEDDGVGALRRDEDPGAVGGEAGEVGGAEGGEGEIGAHLQGGRVEETDVLGDGVADGEELAGGGLDDGIRAVYRISEALGVGADGDAIEDCLAVEIDDGDGVFSVAGDVGLGAVGAGEDHAVRGDAGGDSRRGGGAVESHGGRVEEGDGGAGCVDVAGVLEGAGEIEVGGHEALAVGGEDDLSRVGVHAGLAHDVEIGAVELLGVAGALAAAVGGVGACEADHRVGEADVDGVSGGGGGDVVQAVEADGVAADGGCEEDLAGGERDGADGVRVAVGDVADSALGDGEGCGDRDDVALVGVVFVDDLGVRRGAGGRGEATREECRAEESREGGVVGLTGQC
ncbi:MAG: hypothetical protein R3B70_12780 [Polyangiaceae bacterium]